MKFDETTAAYKISPWRGLRSRVQKFPAWHTKAAQMENAVRDI